METYQKRVFNTVLSLVQNQEDAKDVTQEVFVKVYETLATFKGESSLSTWIYRIATNKALDALKYKRTKKRFGLVFSIFGGESESLMAYEIPDFYHPGVALERKEDAAVLFKAIEQLPENQKVAFTLNKIDGLSYAEIAEIMEVSVSSVDSLLSRAKQNLQRRLRVFYKSQ